jgi:hypothetical protein
VLAVAVAGGGGVGNCESMSFRFIRGGGTAACDGGTWKGRTAGTGGERGDEPSCSGLRPCDGGKVSLVPLDCGPPTVSAVFAFLERDGGGGGGGACIRIDSPRRRFSSVRG